MFTGIIETLGTIEEFVCSSAGARVVVTGVGDDPIKRGESIAVNGVCLTALPVGEGSFAADLSPETMARTMLSDLAEGTRVNIERALRLGDRLSGHIVQGHVDAVGSLSSVIDQGEFSLFRWSFPAQYRSLLVEKGSVAVDGISLTVVDPEPDSFAVALIPETLRKTNLRDARVGTRVNLEFDVMAKFAQQLLGPYMRGS